jgi:iron complex transport system permease protein
LTGVLDSFGNWALVMAATLGSGLILLLILSVSVRIRDIMTILILGILFGSIATALVAVLQYFSSESMLKSFIVWTMGSLGNVTGDQLFILGLIVFTGVLISFSSVKILNAMLLGEDYARTLGVNVKTVRMIVFVSTSLLAGAVTAFCGPVGFIGIVVPHIARLVFQSADHKILLPGSLLIGTIFMLISDIFSKLPGYDQVLPINSVTALMGIPVIIWIIVKRKKIISLS